MSLKKPIFGLYNQLSYWALPPGINNGIQYLYKKVSQPKIPSDLFDSITGNKMFYNLHKGERCFILATGPSINLQDLKPLKNEICIAVSAFFLHKDVKEIAPRYHVEAPNHLPFRQELPRMCFEGYHNYYTKQTTIFLGHTPYEFSYYNFLKRNPTFYSDNIRFLNYTNSPSLNEINYNNPQIWDITNRLFSIRSVVFSAIQLAAFMGFKEIYLLGCDLNYLANLSKGKSTHFYSDEKSIVDDSIEWNSISEPTETFLFGYYNTWKDYRLIRKYLRTKQCEIYNASAESLLDVFPRVRLEEIIEYR